MMERNTRPTDMQLVGGWDARFAKVVRVFVTDDVALAMVDTNGDGAEVVLEPWEREGDRWLSTGVSTTFGSDSAGRGGGMVYAAGYAGPGTVVKVAFGDAIHEVLADDDGLWAWVGHDDPLDTDLPRQV